MKLKTVLEALRRIAPEGLAEPWDKVGLQVGSEEQNVRRALLCIDLTEDVMAEAVATKTNLIVAYHPPIFDPLARLIDHDWKQRIIRTAVQKNIAVYSPHTALDATSGGVNDWLASGVGRGEVTPIQPTAVSKCYKVVTFIPESHMDAVRNAMAGAGAGRIGDYHECSFATPGQGTFRGGSGTNPTLGKPGRFERVAEWRKEMIVSRESLFDVLQSLHEAHPYEEPAYDVYPLEPVELNPTAGQGRTVELSSKMSITTLVTRMKKHLGVKHLEVSGNGRVHRVGVCAGAGGSLLDHADGVDTFITGEMRHHDVLDAVAKGISIILAGHTQTERPYLKIYRKRLAAETGGAVRWPISKRDRVPLRSR